MSLLRKFGSATRGDQGFSMVVTMGVISVMLMSTALSMSAVGGDQGAGRTDRDRKASFAAAEAGLQVYVHKLLVDNNYWDQCTAPTDGVYQYWDKVKYPNTDTRTNWKYLPDRSAAYAIETMPANGAAACDKNAPEDTVIDKLSATFRVRVSGRAAKPDGQLAGPTRSLIATFKRKSFLDYIYFTDLEVTDPTTYKSYPALNASTKENPGNNPGPGGQRDVVAWGNDACSYYAYEKGENNKLREDQVFYGQSNKSSGRLVGTTWNTWQMECREIRFVDGDAVMGPMHTNDSLLLCGSPEFGRKPGDAIETSSPGTGTVVSSYRQDPNCGTSAPDVNYENQPVRDATKGTWRYNQPLLQLPASNKSLKDEAPANYTFRGETTLVMSSTGVTITGRRADGTIYNNTKVPYPTDGVIYVDNVQNTPAEGPACSGGYRVDDPYGVASPRTGCGIARISGEYNASLTIGAADDVIIMDDVRKASGTAALLGLIAQNFIRVYHPVVSQSRCNDGSGTTNQGSPTANVEIDAALLTLAHSFIVDNYLCGTTLGTLNVNGAISQKYRGPVGTGSRGSSVTGYLKKYEYDDRLAVRSPPKFLDPVQSAWRIKTFQEQSPAQDPPH